MLGTCNRCVFHVALSFRRHSNFLFTCFHLYQNALFIILLTSRCEEGWAYDFIVCVCLYDVITFEVIDTFHETSYERHHVTRIQSIPRCPIHQ